MSSRVRFSEAEKRWAPIVRVLVACKGKKQFDEIGARANARKMTLREGEQHGAYRCTHCGHWHSGRVDKEAR